jgi:hypothetical protein
MITSEFRKNDIKKGETEGIAGKPKLAPHRHFVVYDNPETGRDRISSMNNSSAI